MKNKKILTSKCNDAVEKPLWRFLTPAQQLVIGWACAEKLSDKEVALLLELSVGTVRGHILTARKLLGLHGKSQRALVKWYFSEGPGADKVAA